MNPEYHRILSVLKQQRGIDFSGYRPGMVGRRIALRMQAAGLSRVEDYCAHLRDNPGELERLLDCLTIKVSRFFRNPLVFEYLARHVLPRIIQDKSRGKDRSLRVWSAGCSLGEEAYSLAILLTEHLGKEDLSESPVIFGTDIDASALQEAEKGIYAAESLKEVKLGLIKRYFTPVGEQRLQTVQGSEDARFRISPEIRELVFFSVYDILAPETWAPPESVFGGFDLICCRNVLIYFEAEQQQRVFDKLYQALIPGGFLVLGESEAPPREYEDRFIRHTDSCRIYRKR